MRRGSKYLPFTGVPVFAERLQAHLQRLGWSQRQAAYQIGCSVGALNDAVAGRAVAVTEVARLYAWVAHEDRRHVSVRVPPPDAEPVPSCGGLA